VDGNRPIGWWVKRLDELLEQVVEHAVRDDGLTRRHWQVLHELAAGTADRTALASSLAPFAGTLDLDGVVADLRARGWMGPSTDALALSAEGSAAHDRLLAEVTRMRRQVTEGLSAEEYGHTLAVLERMAGNVERALADRR
jgi:hypothetical protein